MTGAGAGRAGAAHLHGSMHAHGKPSQGERLWTHQVVARKDRVGLSVSRRQVVHACVLPEVWWRMRAYVRGTRFLGASRRWLLDTLFCAPNTGRPLSNAHSLSGKIVVVQRGGCPFTTKVMYVQAAGAIGMILVGLDNKERFSEVMQIAQGRHALAAPAAAAPDGSPPSVSPSTHNLRVLIPVTLCPLLRALLRACSSALGGLCLCGAWLLVGVLRVSRVFLILVCSTAPLLRSCMCWAEMRITCTKVQPWQL